MICVHCHKNFEGHGVICPSCELVQATMPSDRSHQIAEELASNLEDFELRMPLCTHRDRILAYGAEILFFIPVIVAAFLFAITALGDSDLYLLHRLFSDGPDALVPSSKQILTPALLRFQFAYLVLSVTYYIGFELFFRATPGKLLLGLILTDVRGERASLRQLLVRNLMRYVFQIPVLIAFAFQIIGTSLKDCNITACEDSWWNAALYSLPFLFILPILNYIFFFYSNRRQGLHDLFSGVYVLELESPTPEKILVAICCSSLGIILCTIPIIYLRMAG